MRSLRAVTSAGRPSDDPGERAREHRNSAHAAICDVLEPWAHGTVARAPRYPSFWDFNVVRVEEEPRMSVDELVEFADEALAGLPHRRVDFDQAAGAESVRAEFEAKGWRSERLVWMRHASPPAPGPAIAVEEVPYDAARDLRVVWHREDFPGVDLGGHVDDAREVAMRLGAHVLAVEEAGSTVGFAQFERQGQTGEITHVYVHPDHRGAGYGTALTRAAIEAAGDARDLWIIADDEGRPKNLYARLGFRPAWILTQFLRVP